MNLRSIILYVAGPYGSFSTIEENIKIAADYSQELWNAGFTVICPHTNTGQYFKYEDNGGIHKDDYLEGYLYIVPRCDGVVLLSDWEKSTGAVKEHNLAREIDIPVFDIERDSIEVIKQYFIDKAS